MIMTHVFASMLSTFLLELFHKVNTFMFSLHFTHQ